MNRLPPNDTNNQSAFHPQSSSITAPPPAAKATGASASSAAGPSIECDRDLGRDHSSACSSSSSTSSKRTRKRKKALRQLYNRGKANRLSHLADRRGSAADDAATVTTAASGSSGGAGSRGELSAAAHRDVEPCRIRGDASAEVKREETAEEEPLQRQREEDEREHEDQVEHEDHDDGDEDGDEDHPHVTLSWIQHYIELQQYHLSNGDVNVSSKGPRKNKKLAKWVNQQKREYWKWRAMQRKKERELEIDTSESCEINEERIQLLENIGMEWDLYPAVSYNRDNGGDVSIGESTKNAASAANNNNGQENANTNNAMNLLLLARSKSDASGSEEASSSSSPSSPSSSSSSSSSFSSTHSRVPAAVASAASARDPLPPSHSVTAACSGEDRFDQGEWLSRYMDLLRFHSQFQHADVPLTYPPNNDLALWVAEQRRQYKLLLRGKPSKLTDVHLQLLEKVGFQLEDADGSEWKLRFQEMQLFRSRYGHYDVNAKAGMGSQELENWVRDQVVQKALLDEGKPSFLNEERVTLLHAIGFPWNEKMSENNRNLDSSADSATSTSRKRQFSASKAEQEVPYSALASALAASAKRIKFETDHGGPDEDREVKLTAVGGCTQHALNLDSKPHAKSPTTSNNQSLIDASNLKGTAANFNQNPLQLNQDLLCQILLMQSNKNSTPQQQMTQSSASPNNNNNNNNNVAREAPIPNHTASANIATSAPSSESVARLLSLQNNDNFSAGSFLNNNDSIHSSKPNVAQLLHLQKMQADAIPSAAGINSNANAPVSANGPNNNPLSLLLAQILRAQSNNNHNISPAISNPNNGPSANNNSNANNNNALLAQLLQLQNQILLKNSSASNHSNFLPSPEFSNHVRNTSSTSIMGALNQAPVSALTLQQLLQNNSASTNNMARNLLQGNNSLLSSAFPSLSTGVQLQQQQSLQQLQQQQQQHQQQQSLQQQACIQALQAQLQGSNANSNNLNSNNTANLANALKMIFASQQQPKSNASSSFPQSQPNTNPLPLQPSDLLRQLSAATRVVSSVASSSAAGPSPNSSMSMSMSLSQPPEHDSSHRKKSRSSTGKGEQWFRRFNELKMYKALNGNCNVPKRFEENPALGTWVSNQRSLRRLMMEGKPSHMTPERVQLLESIGFEWHPPAGPNARQEEQWRARFKELEEFKREHHHCRVPTKNYQPNPALGQWVNDQRRQYRLMNQGLTSSMTVERMMLLTNLGFEWSLGKRKS